MAFENDALSDVMQKYLYALKTGNAKTLKNVVTPHYLKMLNNHNTLKTTIKKNRDVANKEAKIQFDIKTRKSLTKNEIYVAIKDKKKKDFGHHWYVLRQTKRGLFIHDMIADD